MSSGKSPHNNDGPSLGRCEEGYDITIAAVSSSNDSDDSSSDRSFLDVQDPEAVGYVQLRDEHSSSSSDSDLEHVEEIEQRQRCDLVATSDYFGASYDESLPATESPPTSDESRRAYDDDSGKTESCSKVLFSSSPVVEKRYLPDVLDSDRQAVVDTEYDEAHVAVSSSPEVSPRDGGVNQANHNRYNKYSRHSAVDRGINFSLSTQQPTNFNVLKPGSVVSETTNFKETSSLFGISNKNQSGLYNRRDYGSVNHQYARNYERSVKIPIEDDALVPGQTLHKRTTSSFTQDAEPSLSRLDRSSANSFKSRPITVTDSSTAGPRFSNQMPGYDDRYGDVESLENQHPDRNTGRSSQPGSSSMGSNMGGKPMPIPEVSAENSSLNRRKEKRKKKAEHEKNAWSKAMAVPGHVGDKNVDEILAYLGEDNSMPTENKKKKEKKEKKKGTLGNTEKRKETSVNISSKKEDSSANVIKKKPADNTSKQKTEPTETLHSDGGKSAIIQTTSNRGQVSRIILHGAAADDTPNVSADVNDKPLDNNCAKIAGYSERNIDEEIEKSLRKEVLIEPLSKSEPLLGSVIEFRQSEEENRAASLSTDVTYDLELLDPVWVEEEFVRLTTPEPVEEEFKEVVHKKKKGYIKSQSEREVPVSASSPMIAGKPLNRAAAIKPRSVTDQKPVNQIMQNHPRSTSPLSHKTGALRAKEYNKTAKQNLTDEAQYDMSEKSFPTLFGEHKTASTSIQRGLPTAAAPTWAAKVASKKTSSGQQLMAPGVVGSGETKELVTVSAIVNEPTPKEPIPVSVIVNEPAPKGPVPVSMIVNGPAPKEPVPVSVIVNEPAPEKCQALHAYEQIKSSPISNIENPNFGARNIPDSMSNVTTSVTKESVDSSDLLTHRVLSPRSAVTSANSPLAVAVVAPTLSDSRISYDSKNNKSASTKPKVVEFVDRFTEPVVAPSPAIEFGFGDDTPMNIDFGFGIDAAILSKTSLNRSRDDTDEDTGVKPRAASNANSSRVGVDILQQLLSMSGSSRETSQSRPSSADSWNAYPDELQRTVKMISREWSQMQDTLHAEKSMRDSAGASNVAGGRNTVVYWSEDMD